MKCFLIGNYRNVMAKKRIHVIKNLFFNYYLIRLFRTACSRLLLKNISIDIVAECTGLSVEEIEKL
jgi:hypothetical protein